MDSEVELLEKKETLITDNDLSALEAWVVGSSHNIFIGDAKTTVTQEILEEEFKKNRKLLLTPQNVLLGFNSVDKENEIRKQPYIMGFMTLFGPKFVFSGLKHELLLDELSEEGEVSKMKIKLTDKDGNPVDPKNLNLSLDKQFEPFFDEMKYNDDLIELNIKKADEI